jgi:hypothetical protein
VSLFPMCLQSKQEDVDNVNSRVGSSFLDEPSQRINSKRVLRSIDNGQNFFAGSLEFL